MVAIISASILGPMPFAGTTYQLGHLVTVRGAFYESDGTPRSHAAIIPADPDGEILGTSKTDCKAKYKNILYLHHNDAGQMRTQSSPQRRHNLRKHAAFRIATAPKNVT